MIPQDRHGLPRQDRAARLAVCVLHREVAQVDGPRRLAVQREREHAVGAEGRIDPLAVRDRRRGREARGHVRALVRQLFEQRSLPQLLPGGAVQREHAEGVHVGHRRVVVRPGRPLGCRDESLTDGDRRRHEQPLAPEHRRRVPLARQLDLPAHVTALAPGGRRVRGRRLPRRERAAPAAPLLLRRDVVLAGDPARGGEHEESRERDHRRAHFAEAAPACSQPDSRAASRRAPTLDRVDTP